MSPASPSPEVEPAPAVVLVVEDVVLVRTVVTAYLREAGFQVIEATNADEAIDVLGRASVNVVFSDVRMPGTTDGHGLADWVRRHKPGVKVLLGSGAELDNPDESILRKPYDHQELLRRMRSILN